MTRVALLGAMLVFSAWAGARPAAHASASSQSAPAQAAPAAAEVQAAIDKLGSFDYPARTGAAKLVRRAPADVAVPLLAASARKHTDEYVRYRALTLLAGFGGPVAAEVMSELKGDPNDRVRMVAYAWFEHNPDAGSLPALIDAFSHERSEFVRPALTRAIAVQWKDPRAKEVLAPVVLRGDDFFRGPAIEALGEFGASFALADIVSVAQREGPLQGDAITAIGRIGDVSQVNTLVALQKTAPAERQPTVAAALCLLGKACAETEEYLRQTVAFAATNHGYQPLMRDAAHALAMLALKDKEVSWKALLDAGIAAKEDDVRAPVALAVGLVALRRPDLILSTLEARADTGPVIELLSDSFDMLSEDFEEERFYVFVRKAYWAAPADSPRRKMAEALMVKLDF
jgi:HEAT repeat protein